MIRVLSGETFVTASRFAKNIFDRKRSMKRRWNILCSEIDAGEDSESLFSVILRLRGIETEEDRTRFLMPDYDRDLADPFLFSDMSKLVDRVRDVRERGERIGIFGDYDADGVTSSVILRRTLERFGIPVSAYIPEKTTEGHGLHPNALNAFEAEGIRLVFTVDCGMMNHAEIDEANRRGMDVIVIDHHHVPEVLPAAFAIVNPKLPGSAYPFRELCGAGTTFRVSDALYRAFSPEKRDELKWLLDLVAIGTVSDCMPLVGENRVLVRYGLIVLAKTRVVGLREMFRVGSMNIDEEHLPDAETIAFRIGPRINAASRMSHAKAAHELLMTERTEDARLLALDLEEQNRARQKVSEALAREVRIVGENLYRDKKLIFAVGEHYPLGVAGLVAGKISHELGKPTAVFAKGETESTGSFRSIPALNIIESIGQCSELLEKFGGHSQAAGATIRNEHLEAFYTKLEAIVDRKLAETDMTPTLDIDCELSPFHLTKNFFSALRKLSPFGMGNPEPTFLLRYVLLEEARYVGSGEQHLKCAFRTEKGVCGGIGFGMGRDGTDFRKGDTVDVVFHLAENRWNGVNRLELRLLDMQKSGV